METRDSHSPVSLIELPKPSVTPLLRTISISTCSAACTSTGEVFANCRFWLPKWSKGRDEGSVPVSRPSHTQFVLVREADAVYAFTAMMASLSLAGRCREVAVTHSPGLTDLTASTLPTGTWNLKVTYWRGDS